MPHTASRFQPGAIALAVLLALALPSAPLLAQTASPEAPRPYEIAAGPLEEVLTRFTARAGIALSFDPALVNGRHSSGLIGHYTDEQGLQRILQGSGLEAVAQTAGGYTLRRLPATQAAADGRTGPAAPTLAAIWVTARSERGGPTEGTASFTTHGSSAATGMNLSLRETPQSISVITRERLDEQNLNTLTDALSEVTGIYSEVNGTRLGNYTMIYSRGYQVYNYQVDGLSTLEGGAYVLPSFDTAVYDSIAVVRGATGLLTGNGNPGGSVQLTRKRPTRDFQASLALSLGQWRQHRTVGDLSGRLNETGTLRGRLVAAWDDGQSWIDRYQGHKVLAYGVLEADLSPRTLLTMALEHGRTAGRGAGGDSGFSMTFGDGSLVPARRGSSALADWSRFATEGTTLNLKIEHQISERWRAQLGYSHGRRRLAGQKVMASVEENADANMGLFMRNWREMPARTNDLAGKLEGQYELFGRRNDVVIGFSASNQSNVYEGGGWFTATVPWSQWDGHVPVMDPADPDTTNAFVEAESTRMRQAGVYAATRLRPSEDLSVILGGRWSNWQTRTTQAPSSTSWDPDKPVSDDRKESAVFTPYAGVVYDLNRSLSVYASYTEIFNPQYSQDVTGNLLDPESGKNTELGLKGAWLDGRLNASVAVFQVHKDNLAVPDGDRLTPSGGMAFVAEDDTRGRGWELEVSGQLARGWQMQAGYTRMVTRDSDGVRINPTMPVHLFKLFSSYRLQQVPGLTLGGGLVWQSGIYSAWVDESLRSIHTQRSYALANLMARYAINRHWSLALNLNNVFDKHYRTAVSSHVYGAPRNLYATLKYQF